jgi:hypothetical protein
MSALTQVTVTYISTLPSTTSTQVIPIPAALQTLDSDANTNASVQSGFSSFDMMLGNIRKSGGVRFVSSTGILTWVPLEQIVLVQGE